MGAPIITTRTADVLVRLARGLPFSNPDQFNPVEVVAVTEAIRSLARSLRGLIFVVLGSMVSLVIASPAMAVVKRAPLLPWVIGWCDRGASALIGLALSYAFVRMVQVIQSDIGLVDRQAQMLTNAVRSKNAKAFAEQVIAPAKPIETPAGYGEPLH